jgi:hypothetical protein
VREEVRAAIHDGSIEVSFIIHSDADSVRSICELAKHEFIAKNIRFRGLRYHEKSRHGWMEEQRFQSYAGDSAGLASTRRSSVKPND